MKRPSLIATASLIEKSVIDGNDLTTAQHQIGRRFYRQRTGEVHFAAAAATGDQSQQQKNYPKSFQIKPRSFMEPSKSYL